MDKLLSSILLFFVMWIAVLLAFSGLIFLYAALPHFMSHSEPSMAINALIHSNRTLSHRVIHSVHRIAQLDRRQYASQQEYEEWSASACSTTSMTEALNIYRDPKHQFRITDVLQVEKAVHAISPTLGLLDEGGVERTVRHLGYTASVDHIHTLDQIIALANRGTPIIVSFPPYRSNLFWNGHILILTGGNARIVRLVDSSSYNLQTMYRSDFLWLWGGFTGIITPRG